MSLNVALRSRSILRGNVVQTLRRTLATVTEPLPSQSGISHETTDKNTSMSLEAAATSTPATTKPKRQKARGPSYSQTVIKPWKRTADGPLRPMLDLEMPDSHPLYGFFRLKLTKVEPDPDVEGDEGHIHTGYVTFEAPQQKEDDSARSWTAMELRRKNFKDLHTLWYVLARERNLLATQMQTAVRTGLIPSTSINARTKDIKCRKSMARIKQVLNERRLAYLGAVEMVANGESAEQDKDAVKPKVSTQKQ